MNRRSDDAMLDRIVQLAGDNAKLKSVNDEVEKIIGRLSEARVLLSTACSTLERDDASDYVSRTVLPRIKLFLHES